MVNNQERMCKEAVIAHYPSTCLKRLNHKIHQVSKSRFPLRTFWSRSAPIYAYISHMTSSLKVYGPTFCIHFSCLHACYISHSLHLPHYKFIYYYFLVYFPSGHKKVYEITMLCVSALSTTEPADWLQETQDEYPIRGYLNLMIHMLSRK
jgi:hypothetical protein